jgi:hypothetical protein
MVSISNALAAVSTLSVVCWTPTAAHATASSQNLPHVLVATRRQWQFPLMQPSCFEVVPCSTVNCCMSCLLNPAPFPAVVHVYQV